MACHGGLETLLNVLGWQRTQIVPQFNQVLSSVSFLIRSLVLAVLLPAVVIQLNDLFPGLRGHREWRRCLNSLRIMKIKRAIFLLEQATAAAIELRIVTPLKTCAHVLFRMMDMVSIKRGLPFHRCANGFLTNKIGQSLRLHKKE